tara:strand:+ start:825 stop:1613 length:789 start_codon:yes stop_codon:yes gene_type:complete
MSAPRTYNTEGLVLRSYPLGETDRILTIFSKTSGKLRVSARGLRKPKSKLAGHLEPLTCAYLTISRGRTLDIITGAESKESFSSIKENLNKLSSAIYLTELVDTINPLEAPNPYGYSIYLEGLQALEKESSNTQLIVRYMELHLLIQAGYSPELHQCTECQDNIIEGNHYFDSSHGGVICERCINNQTNFRPISVAALKVLRFFAKSTLKESLSLKTDEPLEFELRSLMDAYIRYTLDREVLSKSFIRSVSELGETVNISTT